MALTLGVMQATADLLLTSEASRLLGIAAGTLRDWERRGLITAVRTSSGVRLFARDEILRRAREQQDRTQTQVAR